MFSGRVVGRSMDRVFDLLTVWGDLCVELFFLVDISNDPSYSSRCFKGPTVGWVHFTDFEVHPFFFACLVQLSQTSRR